MPEPDIRKHKQQLRDQYRSLRNSLDSTYRTSASIDISRKFRALVHSKNLNSVGLYFPINSEVNLGSLLHELHEDGIICSLPKISSEMKFLKWTPETKMQKSDFMFKEPFESEEITPEIVAVPLLTCDNSGNRLGYGKGFYDKYLAKHRVISVGICYARTLYKKTLPKESHDIPLDIVMTEDSI